MKYDEKEVLDKISDAVNAEIKRQKIGYTVFADLCGLSWKIMGDLVNYQKNDIKLSTILTICNHSSLTLDALFYDDKLEHTLLDGAHFVFNGKKFDLIRRKSAKCGE